MFVVCIQCGSAGKPVQTCEQSTNLDRAKIRAEFVADDMIDIIVITVRHHRNMDEVYYSTKGTIPTPR